MKTLIWKLKNFKWKWAGSLSVIIMIMVLVNVPCVSALTIDIGLTGNPPPVSADLNSYLYDPDIGALRTGTTFTNVGFNGYDLGDGLGNGVDEVVAFSFQFTPFSSITSATLRLDLTPKHSLITTDQLTFADNWTQPNKGYGNELLESLTLHTEHHVNFDLAHMDVYDPRVGVDPTELTYHNLLPYLLDGDLDVVFADDAIIHSARLTITGNPTIPEPATILLLGMGLAAFMVFRRFFHHRN
ncbi:hypothetical protein GMMP1_1160003 [Candidatus Magnetomoraceae bacterium gMMP-1]